MNFGPPGSGQNSPGPNPFGDVSPARNVPGQSPYKPPGDFREHAYGPYGPPPKPTSGWPKWVLFVLGGIGGGLVVMCAGCCGLGFLGIDQFGHDIGVSLAGNPVVREHLGEIQECDWNLGASMDQEEEVFDVQGTLGKGQIIGQLNDDSSGLSGGELRTSEGSFNLFP